MFIAATAVSTAALYYSRHIILICLGMTLLVYGGRMIAAPFIWFENTFGESSRIERAIAPVTGGWRVYIWNRGDKIVRRAYVQCLTGRSSYVERDIAPGETYEGIVMYDDIHRKDCGVKWEFFEGRSYP